MTSLFLAVILTGDAVGHPRPIFVPVPIAPVQIVPLAPVPIIPEFLPPQPYPIPIAPPIPTMKEFFGHFKPCPGKYEIVVLHPCSNKPVQVCFTLPDCPLKNYEVNKRSVEFDYQNGFEVDIIFRLFGKVDVKYDD